MRVREDRVGAVEVLAEEAHAEEEHLAGETSSRLICADGELGVPVAVERALVDVGAARDDVGVVDDLYDGKRAFVCGYGYSGHDKISIARLRELAPALRDHVT